MRKEISPAFSLPPPPSIERESETFGDFLFGLPSCFFFFFFFFFRPSSVTGAQRIPLRRCLHGPEKESKADGRKERKTRPQTALEYRLGLPLSPPPLPLQRRLFFLFGGLTQGRSLSLVKRSPSLPFIWRREALPRRRGGRRGLWNVARLRPAATVWREKGGREE